MTLSNNVELPPPICCDVPGTFAHDTMSRRVREDILARVFRENNFLQPLTDNLKSLDEELRNGAYTLISPIPDDGGPDVETWNKIILPQAIENRWTWLSAPWLLSEFYLYRRILAAVDYFHDPLDPFQMQKELGLTSALPSIAILAERVNGVLSTVQGRPKSSQLSELQGFVLTALWGNRMDLSLWPVGGDGDRAYNAFASVLEAGQEAILANHMKSLVSYTERYWGCTRIDIVVDNAGFELFCDLCLADFLIMAGATSAVYLQLKAHPTFVSDAMEKDVKWTIDRLIREGGEIQRLGNRWAQHVNNGKWVLRENFYWVQPQPMWDMPQDLVEELKRSTLVFVKGDANYRRLLGDRQWALDLPFEEVVSYFPSPICALRTLKAELGCGMSKESMEKAARRDDNWMVAGKYGVVHFFDPSASTENQ